MNSAYDQNKKFTPGALSSDVLHQNMYHIDSVANKNSFSIIRMCPSADSFPFFSANISIGPDVGRANLIAIGDTETCKSLSSSDLAGCRRLDQTFSCLDWAMTLANF